MSKAEEMRNIRMQFLRGHADVWIALSLFRKWARLTGDHRTADAVERFLKFMED